MCRMLFESDSEVCLGSIPFKDMDDGQILEVLLEDVKDSGAEELKKKIREEIRRWHPDKFWQKVGQRVAEDQKEEVMKKIKEISQALTNYGK